MPYYAEYYSVSCPSGSYRLTARSSSTGTTDHLHNGSLRGSWNNGSVRTTRNSNMNPWPATLIQIETYGSSAWLYSSSTPCILVS